jgi:hypothetical protein
MKKWVPSLAFFAGAVLLGAAIAVLAALWITGYQPVSPHPELRSFNNQMTSARNPDELRQACLSIARVYDAQSQLLELQEAEIARLFNLLVWGLAGVAFVLGPLFIYIYFLTRSMTGT